MAIFKCKMCGGSLNIVEGSTVCECEYCGTKQTVPRVLDESMQNLFNRANTLRMKGEFDKAEAIYEKIIRVDSKQSEGYWGLILCKYGIEYVDDPNTFEKIPTCHRASYESIIADEDYKSALANADFMQRAIYEEQAKEIDRIQKEILALVQKEETYDVFICYKETDASGQRTQDSVIANDIYYQLTNEGFKVFYAAITLEGKLGSAYEPIIFAALNSAKVMLVIGTNPEYFNAVWVKNEWSRYLKIIQKDRSKLLIPCYRDMDAYELPEEFAHLQAQDMSKIGFINDIVRGVKKVIKREETLNTTSIVNGVGATNNVGNIDAFFVRANFLLESGDFEGASAFYEKVLEQDPKNSKAYLGKLLASLKLKNIEELKDTDALIDKDKNYILALNSADESTKEMLLEKVEENSAIAKKQKWKIVSIYSLSIFSLVFSTISILGAWLANYVPSIIQTMHFLGIALLTVAIGLLFWLFSDYFIKGTRELNKSMKTNNIIMLTIIIFVMLGNVFSFSFNGMISGFDLNISLPHFVVVLLILNILALAFYLVVMCKKGVKRIIIGLIISVFSIIVVCGLIDTFFIDPYCYGYSYVINNSTQWNIRGSRVRLSGNIKFPSVYDGERITGIDIYGDDNAFKNVTSVVIPKSVTYISVDSFNSFDNLKYIYCFNDIVDQKNVEVKEDVAILYYSETGPNIYAVGKRYWHYVNGVPTEW